LKNQFALKKRPRSPISKTTGGDKILGELR